MRHIKLEGLRIILEVTFNKKHVIYLTSSQYSYYAKHLNGGISLWIAYLFSMLYH